MAAAFGTATIGGVVLGELGWVTLFTGAAMGFAVGTGAFLASGRHRDVMIQGAAAVIALVGILFAAVLSSLDGAGGSELGRVLVNVSFFRFVGPALGAIAGALIRFAI